jgi:hypothetical protein
MPLLRKISKAKWFSPEWLEEGEVPGDALVDLRTQKNELSVWRVDPVGRNLNAVIAALASNKTDRVDNLDYVLVDEEVLTQLGIRTVQSEGQSPHPQANSNWHVDLVELSGARILNLAHEMKRRQAEHKRVQHKVVREILRAALQGGELQRQSLNVKLLAELET